MGQSLSLKKAVFAGGADFTGARIGGEFNAAGVRFEGSKRALFTGLKVGQHASLLQAVFQGLVDLGGAEIDYLDTLMGAGFTVNNPNAVSACGCGSSFRTADSEGSPGACHH